MDESIGAKGGKNDFRRTMIIKKNQKKKIKEYNEQRELRELEKRVKKQQIYTLIKALPIVLGGEVVKTIHDTAIGKKKPDKEEELSKWRIKEYDSDISSKTPVDSEREKKVIVTPDGEKVIVYVRKKTVDIFGESLKKDVDVNPSTDKKQEQDEIIEEDSLKDHADNKPVKGSPFFEKKPDFDVTGISEISSIDLGGDIADLKITDLPPNLQTKISKIQSRKIVDEYERLLKDVRYELRKIVSDYKVLEESSEKAILSHDSELILEKLSDLITKLEILKSKININDLDRYDDNYVQYLIDGYLDEFKNGNLVDGIKDSPLYIMISEKLDELDHKRDDLSKKVEEKKDVLEDKEINFKKLKEKYYSIDQLNKDLEDMQYRQQELLEEVKEKVANATSITERVHYELYYMNMQTSNLARFSFMQMFMPGMMSALGLGIAVASNMNFLRSIYKPRVKETKYKVVTVNNYHSQISDSISKLDDAISLLGKTSVQIDKIINDLQNKYSDYASITSEYNEMLYKLKRIKSEVEEKEYEMKKMKKEQEKQLEINDAKVLKRGTYPVN